MSGLPHLLRLQLALLRGKLRGWSAAGATKAAILLVLTAAFFALGCVASIKVIDGLLAVPAVGAALLVRLISLLFLTVFTMLFYSTIMTMLSTVYASRDLHLLLALPLSQREVLATKFVETMVRSAYMPVFFGAPFLAYYGYRLGGGVRYAVVAALVVGLFCVMACALGMTVCTVMTAVFPRRRVQQVLAFLGILAGAVIVIVFRMARVERLFMAPSPGEEVAQWIAAVHAPTDPWLPSTWGSEALFLATGAGAGGPWTHCARLAIAAAAALAVYAATARGLFYPGWVKSQETTDAAVRPGRGWAVWCASLPVCLLPRQGRLVGVKDARVFFRDLSQWSQVFMLVPLLVLYLLNIRLLPVQSRAVADIVCFLNLLLAGFLIAAVCARLLFPTVSLEREAVWVIATSPVSYGQVLWAKWLVFVPPLLALALAIVVLSNWMLGVSPALQVLATAAVVVVTVALSGLAVGMGALFPMFRHRNIVEVSLSFYGLVYMVLSLLYLLAVVLALALPVYQVVAPELLELLPAPLSRPYAEVLETGGLQNSPRFWYHLAAVVLLSVVTFAVPMYLGQKSLERREYA